MRSSLLALLLAALAAVSCGDGANVQRLPIGSRCGSSDDCGTQPYNCATSGHPGGYCQKDCATNGDCPSDSVCLSRECRRKCRTSAHCRVADGYICVSSDISVCDVPTSDLGPTSD
jgi:hypothetical protein